MKTPVQYDEPNLLAEIAAGNEEAFAVLFHQWRNKVYTIGLTITRSQVMAEELVQDVFLQLWISRHRLMAVKRFEDYFFILTRNAAYKAFKKMAARRNVRGLDASDLSVEDFSTTKSITEKEIREVLEEAVNNLPPRQQQTYRLVKLQGLTRNQAAEAMNITPEAVKDNLKHATRSVRAYCLTRLSIAILLAGWMSR